MTLTTIFLLIWAHWIGDFILQTDEMAMNKSTSNVWLAHHISMYMLVLFPFGFFFAIANAAAHFATDWITSRITSYLWKKNDRHNFFVVIGLDQALHMSMFILTWPLVNWWPSF